MDRPSTSKARGVCKYYSTARGCLNGDMCKFLHGQGARLSPYDTSKVCKFYAAGFCIRGEKCWFRHKTATNLQSTNESERQGDASQQEADADEPCSICYEQPITYGLLAGCSHVFCLQCLRDWRDPAGKSEDIIESGNTKNCPFCRSPSRFITPSSRFYSDGNPRKAEVIERYKASMARIPCKYFRESKPHKRYCPYGHDCFYQHRNDDGSEYVFPHGASYYMSRPRSRARRSETDLFGSGLPFDVRASLRAILTYTEAAEALHPGEISGMAEALVDNFMAAFGRMEAHDTNSQEDSPLPMTRAAMTNLLNALDIGQPPEELDSLPPLLPIYESSSDADTTTGDTRESDPDEVFVGIADLWNDDPSQIPIPTSRFSTIVSQANRARFEIDVDSDYDSDSDSDFDSDASVDMFSLPIAFLSDIPEHITPTVDAVSSPESPPPPEVSSTRSDSEVHSTVDTLLQETDDTLRNLDEIERSTTDMLEVENRDREEGEVRPHFVKELQRRNRTQTNVRETVSRSPRPTEAPRQSPGFVTDGRGRVIWTVDRDDRQVNIPRHPRASAQISRSHTVSLEDPGANPSGFVTDGRGRVISTTNGQPQPTCSDAPAVSQDVPDPCNSEEAGHDIVGEKGSEDVDNILSVSSLQSEPHVDDGETFTRTWHTGSHRPWIQRRS